jgi:UDP-glucose 4-epimerase
MTNILVTGGAGYIGAHACKALAAAGYTPVTFDNLSTGWADAVRFGPLVRGDLLDSAAVTAAFEQYKPAAVMHFAALSQVGESMQDPGRYWYENVVGALNLVQSAIASGCHNFVFSSTCATYGDQDGVMLDEATAQYPINAYGASKRAIEDILENFAASSGLRKVVFRYFNVAGADPQGEVGEQHVPETHLIPLMLDAIDGKRSGLTIFGTDYDTPDGTCVRDYVHVSDLVDAHVLGLKWLEDGKENAVFNLGTGTGFSVREVIDHSASVTNRAVPYTEGPRRAGDAVKLVSGSQHARDVLGWTPTRSSLDRMIADAWRWHQSPPYKR